MTHQMMTFGSYSYPTVFWCSNIDMQKALKVSESWQHVIALAANCYVVTFTHIVNKGALALTGLRTEILGVTAEDQAPALHQKNTFPAH